MSQGKKIASGLRWNIVDTVAVKGVGFFIILLLTRLLTPEDFGILSIVMVFTTVGTAIIEGGLGMSLIRDNEANSLDYSTILISNVVISLLVYGVVYLIAPWVALFFDEPKITDLLRVLGLNFIIMSLSVVQTSILMKEMDFKTLTISTFPSNVIGGGVAIWAAYTGAGVWSLVILPLVTQTCRSFLLFILSKWKFKFQFSKLKFKKHLLFGYRLVLSTILNTLFMELYSLLIGKQFSVTTLGYYSRARVFTFFPVNIIGSVISNVSYPMLANMQSKKKEVTIQYQKILKSSFFLLAGLMVTLHVIAEPLFLWLFTETWAEFIPYFKIMCLSVVLVPIHEINLNVFKVFDRTDLLLKIEIFKKFLIAMVLAVGYFWDIKTMLWVMVATGYISLYINSYYAGKIINYPTSQQLIHMLPTFLAAIFVGFLGYYVDSLIVNAHLIIRILSLGVLTVSMYLAISYFIKNDGLSELIILAKKLIQIDKKQG
ncbi:MAG: O-antigen/teichoic acid export membrane protein [Cyclobacteriaceae bacterium]|jgi:O-antigen/teichoic acid export membrane protein